VLEQQLFSISVRAKPSEIPQHFEVDVSDLVVGTAVRISDLTIPAGVEVDLDPDTVIAAGQPPRVVRAEGEEGVAAEGEEGVAAPEAGAAGSAEGTTSEES
jgi:large subunit ribosomal protein L25